MPYNVGFAFSRSRLKERLWREQLQEKYPSSQYQILWTRSGATIREKAVTQPRAEVSPEQALVLWRQQIRRRYPSFFYDVKFTEEGATVTRKSSALELGVARSLHKATTMVLLPIRFFSFYPQRRKQIQEWRASIREQHPASQYDIQWTPEGATVTRKPTGVVSKEAEMAAFPGTGRPMIKPIFTSKEDWKAFIQRQYPADKYKIEWTAEGAKISPRGRPMIAPIPKPVIAEKKPEPTITQQLTSAVEWVLGGDLEELAFKKTLEVGGVPEEERQQYWETVGKPTTEIVSGETAYQQTGIRTGRKAIEEFAYVPVGAFSVAESFVSPEPTFVGSTVSYVLTGGKKEVFGPEMEKITEHPGLLLGEAVGEYFAAKAFRWAGGKALGGVKRVTPTVIKEPISHSVKYGRVAKAVHRAHLWRIEHLPTWRGSAVDVYLAKHSSWYYAKTGGIAVGEVVIPPTPEVISYAKLQALSGAFEMTVAPRTGGVWLGKVLVEPTTKKVLPHLIFRGGKISIGYLRETSFQRVHPEATLTPLVSQQQLTRMGVYPYIPKLVSTTGKKGISYVGLTLFVGVTRVATSRKQVVAASTLFVGTPQRPERKQPTEIGVPDLLKSVWQPTLAFERIKYDPTKVPTLEPKKKEKAIPIPRLVHPQLVESTQLPKVEQKTKTTPKTVPSLIQPTPSIPSPSLPTPPSLPLLWTRRGGRPKISQFERGLFGEWFKRKHPIPTAEEMTQRFFDESKVTAKKKRKTKRKGRVPQFRF